MHTSKVLAKLSLAARNLFASQGRLVARFRYLVVGAWVVGAVLAFSLLLSLGSVARDDNSTFLPSGSPSSLRPSSARTWLPPRSSRLGREV
jgi:hypothetical protein